MQVVGYESAVEGPGALRVAEDGTVRREPLAPGRDIAFTLGARHCAGRVRGSHHEPCDRERAPYCDRHTGRWPCARCTGDCAKPVAACDEEHALYLAAFAPDTWKVGVTRSWRLERRLREQGADRAVHARTLADGRAARRLEADVAAGGVPDRVRAGTKRDGLHASVDESAWRAFLADTEFEPLASFSFSYGLALDARPVAATMATGAVRGVKGRLLVLERGGTAYAVDLRDLVGYELEAGASDAARQSSLGAFDG